MSLVSLGVSISPPTESAHMSLTECLLLAARNKLGQVGKIGVISYVRNVELFLLLVLKVGPIILKKLGLVRSEFLF